MTNGRMTNGRRAAASFARRVVRPPSGERKNAEAGTVPAHGDDTSAFEVGCAGSQNAEQQGGLGFGCTRRVVAQEDERRLRLLPRGEENTKIRVGRDQDTALAGCQFEDRFVGGVDRDALADVDGIMAAATQKPCDQRGERVVDEQLQEAIWISRSSTALAA